MLSRYEVSLTVTDDMGDSDTATTTVSVDGVNQLPSADANGPYSGIAGTDVMFDGSGSSDPDGDITDYTWDFGDGSTGSGPMPAHSYATEGSFLVTLTVTDNDGASASATTTAEIGLDNIPPVADANGPYNGTVNIPVSFDATGSTDTDGSIVSYAWDFGDGASGTGASPGHTYLEAGDYTIELTVTDDSGATGTATSTATIGLGNLPPVADANGPYEAMTGVEISFDGTGSYDPDGRIERYDWDFGDGTVLPDAGPTPRHSYATPDTYNVSLTVTDNDGVSDSSASSATVVDDDINLAPVASNDNYSTEQDTTLVVNTPGVLVNDSDPEGDPLTAVLSTGPDNGSLSLNANGSFSYSPDAGFSGTDSFSYFANDGTNDSNLATVSINVTADKNEPPVADPGGPYSGTEDSNVKFDGSGSSDPDGTIIDYEWDFGDGTTGSGVSPVHSYTTAGTYHISLTVTDDDGDMDAANTTVEITAQDEGKHKHWRIIGVNIFATTGIISAITGEINGTIIEVNIDIKTVTSITITTETNLSSGIACNTVLCCRF